MLLAFCNGVTSKQEAVKCERETMYQRVIHALAFQMASRLVRIIENCIRPEEYHDAHAEFYRVCKKGLQALFIQQERLLKRIKPSRNEVNHECSKRPGKGSPDFILPFSEAGTNDGGPG